MLTLLETAKFSTVAAPLCTPTFGTVSVLFVLVFSHSHRGFNLHFPSNIPSCAIHTSWVKYLFESFVQLKNWVVFLLYEDSLYSLDINLYQICDLHILSSSLWLPIL